MALAQTAKPVSLTHPFSGVQAVHMSSPGTVSTVSRNFRLRCGDGLPCPERTASHTNQLLGRILSRALTSSCHPNSFTNLPQQVIKPVSLLTIFMKTNLAVGFAAILCFGSTLALLGASTKYWDNNDATLGAGGPSPTGTWDTTGTKWTTDSTGGSAATTWADGDTAVFSAGSDATGLYTITLSAGRTVGGPSWGEGG